MRKLLSLMLAVMALPVFAAPAVVSGKAPLAIDAKATGAASWEKIYVLTVIYPKLAYSVSSGELLTTLQKRYKDKGVEIYGILRETPEAVNAFAAEHPEFGITLCSDPELSSLTFLKNPSDAFSRASILNKSGKLLWSGDPVDLEMMLKIITEKRYSEREEIRISALVDMLQAALHAGIPADIVKAADRILEVRPAQLSAFNAKAFALEQMGNTQALETMLKERINAHPDWTESYFLLLSAGYRLPELATNRKFVVENFLKNFPDDLQSLNAIAWSLLNNAPYDAEALLGVRAIVKHLAARPEAEKMGKFFATRALLAYRECDIQEAQKYLEQAIALTYSRTDRQALEEFKKYLETVLAK